MVALAADRLTPERNEGNTFSVPLKAAAKVYGGAIACLDATGFGVPGATSATLIAMGVAQAQADNSGGANGDVSVEVKRGTYRFKNSAAGDAIGRTEIRKVVYLVDDQTVAKTSATNTRSIAGVVDDVDATGVWVRVGFHTAT